MSAPKSYTDCKLPGSPSREPASLAAFARPQGHVQQQVAGTWRSENETVLNFVARDDKLSGTITSFVGNKPFVGNLTGYFTENLVAFIISWPGMAALCAVNGQLVAEQDHPALYLAWDLSIWPQESQELDSLIGTQRFYRVSTS